MKYDIVHQGTVREVMGRTVVVAIEAACACEGCKVGGLCGLSGEPEKEIAVYDKDAASYNVGDEVAVGIGTAMALKAVVWSYIAPLLLMLATLLTLTEMKLPELTVGLATLGVAAVYFVVLRLSRRRLERDIIFKISKIG
jgi:positive regulator of sigma E activity